MSFNLLHKCRRSAAKRLTSRQRRSWAPNCFRETKHSRCLSSCRNFSDQSMKSSGKTRHLMNWRKKNKLKSSLSQSISKQWLRHSFSTGFTMNDRSRSMHTFTVLKSWTWKMTRSLRLSSPSSTKRNNNEPQAKIYQIIEKAMIIFKLILSLSIKLI